MTNPAIQGEVNNQVAAGREVLSDYLQRAA